MKLKHINKSYKNKSPSPFLLKKLPGIQTMVYYDISKPAPNIPSMTMTIEKYIDKVNKGK